MGLLLYKVRNYESIPHFLTGALLMYLMNTLFVITVFEQFQLPFDFAEVALILGGLFFILLAVIMTIMYYKLKADNLEQASQKKVGSG